MIFQGFLLENIKILYFHHRIDFEPQKLSALCILLKRDLQDYPSLVTNGIAIVEAETIYVLEFHFWYRAAMIDKVVLRSRQSFGCLCGILTLYSLLTRLSSNH